MAQKKGLGRGLSALIPENDMELLRRVARGDEAAAPAVAVAAIPAARKGAGSGKGTPIPKGTPTGKGTLTGKATATAKGTAIADGAIRKGGSTTTDSNNAASEPRVTSANGEETALPEGSSGPAAARAESAGTFGSSGEASAPPMLVDVAAIVPNRFQPRRQFSEEEMQNLADSIREHGVLQPVLLRETDVPGSYELVAGERRWRAVQRAGLAQIPALIRVLDDRQSLELAIIENVQRHDISAVDTALAYQKLSREFQLSQEDIARRVGKSRSAIANTMRLLDLPEEVRKAIDEGSISEGHGRAILSAAGEGARRAIFRRVMRDGLSVRDTERLSTKARATATEESDSGEAGGKGGSAGEIPHTAAELRDLERQIEKTLGLRVSIRANGNAGSVVIRYLSSEDLERLRGLLSRAE